MSEDESTTAAKPGFKKPMDKPTSITPRGNQSTQPMTQTQPAMQPVEQAAGFGEALSSLLSTGGTLSFGRPNLRSRKDPQATYKEGAIKGMTQEQAVEYGKQQWEKASPEIREKYARRVQNRPAASEKMAAFNQMEQVQQAQSNISQLPGADPDLVEAEKPELMTSKTPANVTEKMAAAVKPQWKKPMDKPTSGAGYGTTVGSR